MSTAMMSAPSSASRIAWLRPWPWPAPVMKATLPATRPAMVWWFSLLGHHLIIAPASTGSVTPVMYLASSEARNRIALLMSTGSTQGMSSALSDLNAATADSIVGLGLAGSNRPHTSLFWIMIVFTPVGWTLLTR